MDKGKSNVAKKIPNPIKNPARPGSLGPPSLRRRLELAAVAKTGGAEGFRAWLTLKRTKPVFPGSNPITDVGQERRT